MGQKHNMWNCALIFRVSNEYSWIKYTIRTLPDVFRVPDPTGSTGRPNFLHFSSLYENSRLDIWKIFLFFYPLISVMTYEDEVTLISVIDHGVKVSTSLASGCCAGSYVVWPRRHRSWRRGINLARIAVRSCSVAWESSNGDRLSLFVTWAQTMACSNNL
jgi:hypothetical protein